MLTTLGRPEIPSSNAIVSTISSWTQSIMTISVNRCRALRAYDAATIMLILAYVVVVVAIVLPTRRQTVPTLPQEGDASLCALEAA